MDQGATQSQLLLHATGQLPRPPPLERLYLPIDIPYQIVVLLDRRIEDRSEEVQVLLHRQVLVEREAAGHIPYPPTDLLPVPHHVQAADGGGTAIGQQQRGQDTEQGGLPRPVRTDQPEQLAGGDLQREVAQGLDRTIAFTYMIDYYIVAHIVLI